MGPAGDTTMLATCGVTTWMFATPNLSSTVAVIVTGPGATAVMRPEEVTVAIVGADDAHVTVLFVTTAFFVSRTSAVAVCVAATSSWLLDTETVTDFTETGGSVGSDPPQAATSAKTTAAKRTNW